VRKAKNIPLTLKSNKQISNLKKGRQENDVEEEKQEKALVEDPLSSIIF